MSSVTPTENRHSNDRKNPQLEPKDERKAANEDCNRYDAKGVTPEQHRETTFEEIEDPDLENSIFSRRCHAKWTAYFDMVLSIVGIVVCLWASFIAISTIDNERYTKKENVEAMSYVIATICVVRLICSFARIFLTWLLFSATKKTMPPPEAIYRAQCWFYFHLFFTVFAFVSAVALTLHPPFYHKETTTGLHIANVCYLVLRGNFLLIVYRFIRLLEDIKNSAQTETQQGIPLDTMPMLSTSTSMQMEISQSRQSGGN